MTLIGRLIPYHSPASYWHEADIGAIFDVRNGLKACIRCGINQAPEVARTGRSGLRSPSPESSAL